MSIDYMYMWSRLFSVKEIYFLLLNNFLQESFSRYVLQLAVTSKSFSLASEYK